MSSWPVNPIRCLCSATRCRNRASWAPSRAQVGVEQRVVALAAAPQHVVLATQPVGDLEHVLDLRRREGEHLGIGVRGRAALVARMGEQVRGAPQQPDAGPFLVARGIVGQRVQVRAEVGEARPLRRDVAVVEAVARHAELGEELEGHRHLLPGRVHRVARPVEPRPIERPDPEHVRAGPRERVPEADARPEVVLHPGAEDEPIAIVDLERERLGRVESLEADRSGHLGEERVSHRCTSSGVHGDAVVRQGPSRSDSGVCPAARRPVPRGGPGGQRQVHRRASRPGCVIAPGSTTRRWSAPT